MTKSDQKEKFDGYVIKLKEKSDVYDNLPNITLSKITDEQMYSLMDLADRELALWETLQKNEPDKSIKEIHKIVISGKYHTTSLLDTVKNYQSP